ncbi:MAG: ABC transporter ATP-binding protein [Solirubrobacteraceae bacterium]
MATATDETSEPLLSLRNLSVGYRTRNGLQTAVDGISLEVRRGEVLALVGESGSGKTTTGHAILGLLPGNGEVLGGEIRHAGRDLVSLGARELRAVRGKQISLIPQDPGVSLDPVRRIGRQISDILDLHTDLDRTGRRQRVYELLEQVGFSDVERRYRQYPHELSGGMRQRVLIAIAIACEPDLIIADEPTSGLDVTVQARVLDLLDDLRAKTGTTVVFVTHDLGVAADRSDRIAVMQGGKLVESGETAEVISRPAQAYTRRLLDSVPSRSLPAARPPVPADREIAIEARNLSKVFHIHGGDGAFRAVDDVSFTVPQATTLAIVGESGSGKSTIARMLTRLVEPSSGEITLLGTEIGALSPRAFRPHRRQIQIVYQNPYASFDPRFTVYSVIEEPLRAFGIADRERVVDALEGAALPASFLERKPAELSGGQRQRVAIARAVALEPKVVVLDEPISALDVSVQAQILQLLADLQQRLGLTYVFISHDLSVVRAISDRVAVMNAGKIVELGDTEAVFANPQTEYTAELIAAIPGRRLSPRAPVTVAS